MGGRGGGREEGKEGREERRKEGREREREEERKSMSKRRRRMIKPQAPFLSGPVLSVVKLHEMSLIKSLPQPWANTLVSMVPSNIRTEPTGQFSNIQCVDHFHGPWLHFRIA